MKLSKPHISLWAMKILLLACILCSNTWLYAQQPAALFTLANTSYKANEYAQAANQYEKLLAQGYKDATLYYNLGNCYYKLNNVGKAIVNYERAHRLAPDDEDISHNLKLANAHKVDKIEAVPQLGIITGWQNFVGSQSIMGWGWYAIAGIWLAFLAFAAYLFTAAKKITAALGVLFIILSIAFASLAFTRSSAANDSGEGVLTAANSYAKSAPDDNSTNIFEVHEGIKFTLLDKVSNWYKVRLADGKTGWIERTHFEKI